MATKKILGVLLMASTLFGCATGSVSFREMSSAYREVVEDYSNDNILINIMRASKNMPMSFLDIPSVIGSGNVSATLGLSAAIYGSNPGSVTGFFSATPASSYGFPSASLSASNSFNFTQSSLDNSPFLTAFITPIKPEAVQNLINNDYFPRSVLFTMLIEKIEIRGPDGVKLESWTNDPLSANYSKFQTALYNLMYIGLSTESTIQKQVLSPPMDSETLNKNMNALVHAYSLPGVTMLPVKSTGAKKPLYQLVRINSVPRMCLASTLNQEIASQFSKEAFCSTVTNPLADPDATALEVSSKKEKKNTLIIQMRSTQKIFNFMGALIEWQNKPNGKVLRVKNSALFAEHPEYIKQEDNDINSFEFFKVNVNNTEGNVAAKVNYMGNTYSVPNNDKSSSATVFSLLSTLLTLNKVQGSIPLSPAVIVK